MSKISSTGNVSVYNDSFFGYRSCKPQKLQRILNNAKAFLAFLTLANIVQGITINGLLKVNVTSIERRFNLLSSESGLIISTYDVAGCLTLLPVSYLGGRGHKPRWIGIGLIVTSVGMMTLALPHFLTGPYVYSTTVSVTSSNENASACLQVRTNSSQSVEAMCAEREEESTSASSLSLNNMKYIFMTGQFLIGAGSTPFAALSLTFLDDSVDPARYPIYIGVYYLGALMGPAIGFILGGRLLQVFTELGVTPDDITTDSPQWVGAWWVGFVMCSIMMLFIAFPILGFPKKLRSTLTRTKTVSDFKSLHYSAKTSATTGNSLGEALPPVDSNQSTSMGFEQVAPLMEMQNFQTVVHSNNKAKVNNLHENATPVRNFAEQPVTTTATGNHRESATQTEQTESSMPYETPSAIESELGIGAEGLRNKENLTIFSSNRFAAKPASHSKETYLDILRIFFRDLLQVLTNKAFMFLSLSAAVLGTIVSGFSTFGPKFVESQFSRSASDAANIFGYIFLPSSALGLMLGSFLMSGLKLRHKKALLTCVVVSVLGLLAQLIIGLSCENIAFAGITVPYVRDGIINGAPPKSLESSCNTACSCPFNAFDPVCGVNGITYYSPCFASCHSKGTGVDHDFSNCSCIAAGSSNSTNETRRSSGFDTATIGKCSITCSWQPLIMTSLFFVVATTFMCAIPGSDLSLRCFPRELRSLSVGVQWILIRTLGTIPGPIIFGSMIDSTCSLWNKVDPCARGLGSCVMYENQDLSYSMLILSIIFKGASVIFFFIAWFTYVPAALKKSKLKMASNHSKIPRTFSAGKASSNSKTVGKISTVEPGVES